MSKRPFQARPRDIRRAFGSAAAQTLRDHEQAITVCAEVVRRGFWGRWRWLLFGR